jgi:hypothetical protein
VTEKFFSAMERTTIPIVLGATDYHNSAGAPIHSHINALEDFKNPADLAKYLQFLMNSPEKYSEYFWWKQFYKPVSDNGIGRNSAFCELCKQLQYNPQNHLNTSKVYTDLEDWWVTNSNCKTYKDQN